MRLFLFGSSTPRHGLKFFEKWQGSASCGKLLGSLLRSSPMVFWGGLGVCFLFLVGVVLWVRSSSQGGFCTSGVVLIMLKKYVVPTLQNAMGKNSILLVKDLVKLLESCDPDAHVLVDVQALGGNDSQDDFCNVGVVCLPDGDEGHAVILEVLARSYDPRQF